MTHLLLYPQISRLGFRAGDNVEPICDSKCLGPQLGSVKGWGILFHPTSGPWSGWLVDGNCPLTGVYLAWLPHSMVASGNSNRLLTAVQGSKCKWFNTHGGNPVPLIPLLRNHSLTLLLCCLTWSTLPRFKEPVHGPCFWEAMGGVSKNMVLRTTPLPVATIGVCKWVAVK